MDGAPRYAAGPYGVGANTKGSGSAMWSYAVPSPDENVPDYDTKDPYTNGNASYQHDDRKPLSQQSNQARTSQRSTVRSKASVESAGQLYSNIRTDFNDASDVNGDQSDAYGANGAASENNRKRVASRERSRIRRKGSKGAVGAMDDASAAMETSKWIHRDKLAQIESRELAELGVRYGSKASRAGSRRAKSTKTDKSVVETDDMHDMPDEITEEDLAALESRRLRQVADDDAQNAGQRNDERPSTARSGASRIPVPTSASGSPEDTDSPLGLSHKRSASLSRARQQGSQSGIDVKQDPNKSGPSSPSSKTVNGKARKPSATRKASVTEGTRSRSNSTTDKRPGTSSGRPTTARPEGEPPWLANMYKPDPRLPPDQQMLPTHAKRMAEMQKQAEEGARERQQERPEEEEYMLMDSEEPPTEAVQAPAAPVHVEPAPANKRLSQIQQETVQKARTSSQQSRTSYQQPPDVSEKQDAQWPLRTPSGHLANTQDRNATASPSKQSKHDSNSTEHGGYNIMPSISQPKEQQQQQQQQTSQRYSRRSVNSQGNLTEKEREANAALAPVNQPVRLNDPEADGDDSGEKKGCLKCCVVM